MGVKLILPRVSVSWDIDRDAFLSPVLLLLGGRPPSLEWLRDFLKLNPQTELWAADRGLEACMAVNIPPSHAVGDFDSASPEALAWARVSGTMIHALNVMKDETDFQAVLALMNDSCVFVTGAFGSDADPRFDHVLSNVFSLARYAKNTENVKKNKMFYPMGLGDEREQIFFLSGPASSTLCFEHPPYAISLLALTECCTGVSIHGTTWPLENARLELHTPYAISNQALGKYVQIGVAEGILGVYVRS